MDSTKCIKEAKMPQNRSIGYLFVTEFTGECHGLSYASNFGCGLLCLYGATVRNCQGNLEHARRMTEMNFTYVSEKKILSYLWHTLCGTHIVMAAIGGAETRLDFKYFIYVRTVFGLMSQIPQDAPVGICLY